MSNEGAADQTTARICARMAEDHQFEPLGPEPSAIESFRDHDLASLVESRFGEASDPGLLDDAARCAWRERAAPDGEFGTPESGGALCYWLHHRGQRVGTIAWSVASDCGGARLHVSSLYVAPAQRRLGHARRALLALRAAAFAEGLCDVRLEASWYSQPALRFYCSLGMWIRGWKRELTFTFQPDLPSWHVELEGDFARFVTGDEVQPFIQAERRGERLVWSELPEPHSPSQELVRCRAPGTFALALAIEGWPLLRSEAQWQEQLGLGFSDAGGPEGLAFKIRLFEAWAKKNGWHVTTPKIPGADL
jgi:ribosomal protein S18 acetylase RimI-like enzyme